MRLNLILILFAGLTVKAFALVQITGLSDYNFGLMVAPFSDQSQETSFCVCRQSTLGTLDQYQTTVSSAHESGGNFYLQDSGSNLLQYSVGWDDDLTGSFTPLTSSVTSATFTTARSVGILGNCAICPGGNTARMQLSISAANISAAAAGAYSDTLTIVISQP